MSDKLHVMYMYANEPCTMYNVLRSYKYTLQILYGKTVFEAPVKVR